MTGLEWTGVIVGIVVLTVLAVLVGAAAWAGRSQPPTPTEEMENPYRPIYPRETPHLK